MNKEWKIYTKTGDKGETSLLGGRRVPKHHLKIEAYGTADELNAFIGLLGDQDMEQGLKAALARIQEAVFVAESILACDQGCMPENLPELQEEDILFLEEEIDRMNNDLPPLGNFIIPGGDQAVSLAHVCRCVCRRAERIITRLAEEAPVNERVVRYFNRLSDYFFVLARRIAFDKGIPDKLWKSAE